MESIREQVLVAVVAALDEASPDRPENLSVLRHRLRPVTADRLPVAIPYSAAEEIEDASHTGEVDRTFRFRVECRAVATVEAPDAALDKLLTWAEQRVLADPEFGGLALGCRATRIAWALEERDEGYAAAAIEFEVVYATVLGDPTTQG